MPDYGPPLRFATFISPANSPAHRPVELAQLSERLGFDFVTFQDHPYKADFLDTWTLLSWVAARTERIGLSGNVLNLPLCQPPPCSPARQPASTCSPVDEPAASALASSGTPCKQSADGDSPQCRP
jgi:hypothetical protein